jgi:MFS family permease
VRAFADGLVSIVLPAYLLALGLDSLQVGAIATATLLGSALLTLLVGFGAGHFRRRSLLIAAALLMAATGLGFDLVREFCC